MTRSDREHTAPAVHKTPSRLSMHEGIPDWDDCCTCAAEPYWLEAGEAMAREAAEKETSSGSAEKGHTAHDADR